MKQFKWGWFLLLALALTALLYVFDALLYKLHIRGVLHHLVLGFIIAIPLALITKPRW
ncbi:hypothetical protein [Segetibacter sp. 3557_3]|uniref:hypothetical protein n=1 Tax=Segetibacter sp. 3557_3 TaxID=2547429 RepID=UPI0014043C54|nr:hypothetical protein [Segetibacter sp. 3557_3]